MVKVVKHDRQFIAENVVTYPHMEDGVGSGFIRRPGGLDFPMGNESDDWIAGGDSFDTLADENPEPFFNFTIMGHDVIQGRWNDDDYDPQTGDDMSGPIFSNQQINILRNRFDLVEGPSGCKLSDKLTGRDVVIGGCDHRRRTLHHFRP